jgi:hypothetical protein
MAGLLEGPLAVNVLQTFLDGAQALLTNALLADPNNQIGDTPEAVAEHFDSLRAWAAIRHANVSAQPEANGSPAWLE